MHGVLPGNAPFVIAEMGSCHEGSLDAALALVQAAAMADCSAVKLQLYDAARLCQRRNAPQFQDKYARYQLPHEWLPPLKQECLAYGLPLIISVYDCLDLEAAVPYADYLKISSFEAMDKTLRDACALVPKIKGVVISGGMTREADLNTLRLFRIAAPVPVYILHCISAYPAPVGDLNLAVMERHGLDGFSDHSGLDITGAVAVGNGAKMLEVHYKLPSTTLACPDFPHALYPEQLAKYVTNARLAEQMRGVGFKRVAPSELPNMAYKVRA